MRFPVAVLAVVLALAACKLPGGGPGPREAFTAWLKAVEVCDEARMRDGLTAASAERLDSLAKKFAAFLPGDKPARFPLYAELCKSFSPKRVQVVGEEVRGEVADVLLKTEGRQEKAPMRLEKGVWKVDFSVLLKDSVVPPAVPADVPAAAPAVPPDPGPASEPEPARKPVPAPAPAPRPAPPVVPS